MIYRLSNGDVGVVGRFPTRDEQLEVDKKLGRQLYHEEQLVIMSLDDYLQAVAVAANVEAVVPLNGDNKNKFPTTP